MTRRSKIVVRTGIVAALIVSAAFVGTSGGRDRAPVAVAPLASSSLAGLNPGTRPQNAAARLNAPIVRTAVPARTRPLRDLPTARVPQPQPEAIRPEFAAPSGPELTDPVVQRSFGADAMPAPLGGFDGLTNNDNWTIANRSARPPDNTGEVGPNHYVEWINVLLKIFDRNGGDFAGPFLGNVLFQTLPNPQDVCRTTNQGDPLVHYDQLANRWVLSQFAFNIESTSGAVAPPFHECVAVSTSPDPTGPYCAYSFLVSAEHFNDYPKMGVWSDGYYFSFNMFTAGLVFTGPAMMAVDREAMLNCDPAVQVIFDPTTFPPLANQQPMLPSDIDGATLPPAGSPNYFLSLSSANNALLLRKFHVDWDNPAMSTVPATPTTIPVAAYDRSTGTIPQQATPNRLDAISDRVMQRLAYRNFGTHESLVVNHTVDAGGNHAGVRWYELRDPNGTPDVEHQGTFAPDAHHRWMGSAAQDRLGNLAVGYSISSSTMFPSIRYAGRLAGDPDDQLSQGEASMLEGTAPAPFNPGFTSGDPRWGDYTHLAIDPVDDCTFWYINEYMSPLPIADGTFRRWVTRVGSFRFCTPTAVTVKTFVARWAGRSIRVAWRTGSEVDALGFNVFRSVGSGPFRKVNRSLIAAKSPATGGASYRFVDRRVRRAASHTYRLQLVDRKGTRSWYGIGSTAVR